MDDQDEEKRTEQYLFVRSGKSEVQVTNNRRLRSTYCTIEANYWQTRSTRGLPATAELLVYMASLFAFVNDAVVFLCLRKGGFMLLPCYLLFRLVPNISLCKKTERISMKFVGGNHYYKRLNYNFSETGVWNRDNRAGYDRIFGSTSIGVATMSNKCRRLTNEFINFTAQTKADVIADTI